MRHAADIGGRDSGHLAPACPLRGTGIAVHAATRLRRAALPLLAVLAAGMAGCAEDLTAVNGRRTGPAPEISVFRDTIGDDALATVSFLAEVPDGDFSYTYGDGSTLEGTIDRATGAFDIVQTLPAGYYLVEVRDTGVMEETGGFIARAEYREVQTFVSGAVTRYDVEVEVGNSQLDVRARDLDRGIAIEGVVDSIPSVAVRFVETWSLRDVFIEEIETRYYASGDSRYLRQSWNRDELATAVKPDRTGEFTLNDDGSGAGDLVRYYDHQITSRYAITLATDGTQQSVLTFEDPGTTVSPDGVGIYDYAADYSGSGFYNESYDDGSQLYSEYAFFVDESSDELFRFDDASTSWAPDADGETGYEPDGSGTGTWRRYDATGVIETCAYAFDTAGEVLSLTCD